MLIHSRLNLSWERHFKGSVFCPQCDAIQWPGYRLIIDPSCLSPTNKHQTKTSLVRRKVRLCTPKFPCTPFTDTQLIFISPYILRIFTNFFMSKLKKSVHLISTRPQLVIYFLLIICCVYCLWIRFMIISKGDIRGHPNEYVQNLFSFPLQGID